MIYLDSFIRGYCHECKKKKTCEETCNGLNQAINSLDRSDIYKDCENCEYRDIAGNNRPCIDCKYFNEWYPRIDMHLRAYGG